MALLDLSQTTIALQRLLEFNIAQIAPDLTPAVTVSTSPPERAVGGANVLNLYCYHLAADPHNRLRPRQSGGERPIASSPLTLVLHYILTAHTVISTQFDALSEQRLLGYAMKTFHDFPVIDDLTAVNGSRVLPLEIAGRGNRFEIVMAQLSPAEALQFWANEDQTTVKPSGYYEVRVAELEAEAPTRAPGIVLSLGAFTARLDAPAVTATESDLPFALPAALGGGQTVQRVSPAKIGPAGVLPDPANVMLLRGTSLTRGVRQQLSLSNAHWSLLFHDLRRVPVDLGLNAALGWSSAPVEGGVQIVFGDELDVARPGGTQRVALYPGAYVAGWTTTSRFETPDGQPRFVDERANDSVFTVNPRIVGVARDAGTGEVTLSFGGAWRLDRGRPPPPDPVAEPELDVLLSMDGVGYRLRENGAPTDPGTFGLGTHELVYRPTEAANASGLHAIRVVVDGAETQPFWIEIP